MNVLYTALGIAALYADKHIVEYLIDKIGMNATEKNGYKMYSPYLLATRGGNLETLRYLDQYDPTLRISRCLDGKFPLIIATAIEDSPRRLKIIKYRASQNVCFHFGSFF